MSAGVPTWTCGRPRVTGKTRGRQLSQEAPNAAAERLLECDCQSVLLSRSGAIGVDDESKPDTALLATPPPELARASICLMMNECVRDAFRQSWLSVGFAKRQANQIAQKA